METFDGGDTDNDRQALLDDVEQSIINLERNLTTALSPTDLQLESDSEHFDTPGPSKGKRSRDPSLFKTASKKFLRRGMSLGTDRCAASGGERRKITPLKTMKNLMKLGKQRPPRERTSSTSDEESPLVYDAPVSDTALEGIVRSRSRISVSSEEAEEAIAPSPATLQMMKHNYNLHNQSVLKAHDFQVCLTIIEARQLAGLNMDPVVCVQIGEQKKYTSVKESTNCPYYNEYFVFDFHMPPVMLFDKIITLSVLQSRNLLRSDKLLGTFKLDVATVWSQADHQFYHKWALLTDPDDIAAGPKGYLKCDVSVIGKGDPLKVPPKSEKDEDDIEANLLLPEGVPIDRQRARFIVRVYRADGLPKMNSTLMANVKRALTGETKDLVDPYVHVGFAGMNGCTSVKKNSYSPVWNEQIVFTEMFPPLCQRMKIQLRDNDPVKPSVIGTHFIDLKSISNDGPNGFLPTFGPAFIHLYGSTRDYSLINQQSNLNTGLGEGVSYRARILISIRTEITDTIDFSPSEVELEPIVPINELSYALPEEFTLLATILDVSMIDKRLSEKPIYFEISMGNAGNSIDGQNQSSRFSRTSDGEELDSIRCDTGSWLSTTQACKAMSHDKIYYHLPYWEKKPCIHVRSTWPDHRRRMYNSNVIAKLVDSYEENLSIVTNLLEYDLTKAEVKLKSALENLTAECSSYGSYMKEDVTSSHVGKTKLDKERHKLCQREIENVRAGSRTLKALITKNSLKDRYKVAQTYLTKLRALVEDPQHSLPDIFIWMISCGKRIAYARIPAREIIYSSSQADIGKLCGELQTIFLKWPGKKASGIGGWAIPAKLHIYAWLGGISDNKHALNGLPMGYDLSNEIRNIGNPNYALPSFIHYSEIHMFQLRAHIYQARSLIGSDASGLSDPFARTVLSEFCKTTQVIDETLSPTWDELLVFDDITIYGSLNKIKSDPPLIVVEIFDQDTVGKSEFIGRAYAKPRVKALEDPYVKPKFPPSLEWFDLTRGSDYAGELLATFELLETSDCNDHLLPDLPPYKEQEPSGEMDMCPIFPVPSEIRPTLAKYRIEVLFWGLRQLKRVHLLTVDKPRVDIECAGRIMASSIIQNTKRNPNFNIPVKFIELELPEEELYRPPLTIRVVDCRSFGRFTLVGTHTINSIHKYMFVPTKKQSKETVNRPQLTQEQHPINTNTNADDSICIFEETHEHLPLLRTERRINAKYGANGEVGKDKRVEVKERKKSLESDADDDEDSKDWWTKYFASVEEMIEEEKISKREKLNFFSNTVYLDEVPHADHFLWGKGKAVSDDKKKHKRARKAPSKQSPKSKRQFSVNTLHKVYPNELEANPEFDEFKEWLLTFELYRGKKTDEEVEDDSRIVGAFKGAIKVYHWPLPKTIDHPAFLGVDPQNGFFQKIPSNDPIHVLVRVYIVKASDLHPMDLNGKADPYVVLHLGAKRVSDKENYVSKNLNPVFGKCFEVEATFPQESLLTVQILDWDLVGSDDMIGETRIDLENRFYSRHRATCGLSRKYEEQGYNRWRDAMKPTQILAKLCKDLRLDHPIYEFAKVRIGKQCFFLDIDEFECGMNGKTLEENMALAVLHRWQEFPDIGYHLVPEHVETRPLYNPNKPGIEKGKLEMWVDMFPMDMPLPGPPIDISPRKPKSYELRIIIWNTDDVVLEDDAFFTGEKMSDIYVKGWLKGLEDCQSTDIHYRSLTGEGNFNWRFTYPFDYLVAEEKIVISKKESMFSWDETESKIPARLELQVWDADHFSADDFLGALTLDLNRFPRGAKSSNLCTLNMLSMDGSVPTVNIFKQKRVKGWWPFYVKKENEVMELTGKVEAEIHLLTKEEAEKNPAGVGRNEPDPLDKPNRPDASFMWFLNPLKSIRYIVWHNYKCRIIKCLGAAGLVLLLFLFFYAIPGYTVKRIIGA